MAILSKLTEGHMSEDTHEPQLLLGNSLYGLEEEEEVVTVEGDNLSGPQF